MGNWAYSLHLAITDYKHYVKKFLIVNPGQESILNLYQTVNDAELFRENLGYVNNYGVYCDYWNRNILTNASATLNKFILGLIYILNNVKAGDLVVISYSGHGEYSEKTRLNKWLLYDADLMEHELYQLLRLFPKGVRVVLIGDCCQNNSMIDYYPPNTDFTSNKKIYEKVFEFDESLGLKMKSLLQNTDTKTMNCELVFISATGSDKINVNDQLSFLKYLNEYYKAHNYKFNKAIYETYKDVKEIMKNDFIDKYTVAFRKLSGYIPLNGDEYSPYDENNLKDVISLDKILPQFKRIGIETPQQFNKAFNV